MAAHSLSSGSMVGIGVGFGRGDVADASNVTTIPSGGNWARGLRHGAPTNLIGQGSAIATLLKKMNGPAGVNDAAGVDSTAWVIMCQFDGTTIENGPRPIVFSSGTVGEDNGDGLGLVPPELGAVDWDAPGAAALNRGRRTAATRISKAIARASEPTGRSERAPRPDTRTSWD